MNLIVLYLEFFKIGLFAVGGGLATIPFLFEMADKYEWLDYEMIGNFLAIAQSAPGAIGVNMAAQTGYQAAGIPGSFIAVFGLISPAIVVIISLSIVLKSFKENKIVLSVFSGLRPASAGLLAAAGFGALKIALYMKDAPVWYNSIKIKESIIFIILFLIIYKFKGHPVIYVAIGAIIGILLGLLKVI
ncbi:MAG: chromate transporter [Treponema sp.]|nr:chromate transporter [Treponema sp.]